MFATIKREFGHLDGVFANAGYSEFLLFEDVTEPMPLDSSANDLWHYQIRLRTSHVGQVSEAVRGGAGQLVSPNVVAVRDDQLDYTKGLLARDPDGHALFFTDK
jgi:hypothetical protein